MGLLTKMEEPRTEDAAKIQKSIMKYYYSIGQYIPEEREYVYFIHNTAPGPLIIVFLTVFGLEDRLLMCGKENDKRGFLPVRWKLLTLSLPREN